MAETHKNMIRQAGYDRGYGTAMLVDWPEIGEEVLTEADGKIVVGEDNFEDVFLSICGDAESNGRQFSPFEFTARELNNLQNGMHQKHFAYVAEIVPYPDDGSALPEKEYDVWDVFEEGIYKGFHDGFKERSREYGGNDED